MLLTPDDKRVPLLKLLLAYVPIDVADREQRSRICEFIDRNTNCFERSNLAGHITGSAWVVNKTGTKVLLTHHKKLGKWLQLGGHADGNTDVRAVAMREAKEESGLKGLRGMSFDIFDLDVHPIPACGAEPEHLHYDIRFAFRATVSEDFLVSNESNELRWVDIDQINSLSEEESLLRMARKWKASPHNVR